MASVQCNCGKTRLLLASSRPRTLTACCCKDCVCGRFGVLHQKGGPKPQENLPAFLHAFENSLVVASGDLCFFKLQDAPCPVNAASSCCNTYMAGHFAPYHHNCVVVPSPETGGGKFLNAEVEGVRPNFMSFRNGKERFDDLLERKPELAGTPEFWFKGDTIADGFDGTGEWGKALTDATAALQEPIVGQPDGKTFQQLIDERGGDDAVEIMAVVQK